MRKALIISYLVLCFLILEAEGVERSIYFAGFMVNSEDNLKNIFWFGLAEQVMPEEGIDILYEGIPTGLKAMPIPDFPGWYRLNLRIEGEVPAMKLLIGAGIAYPRLTSTSYWPHLTSRIARTPTPTATPTFTMTYTPTPIPTPYFRNVAQQVHIRGMDSHRNAFYDMNGDGWLDILMNKQYVLINQSDGKGGRVYIDKTAESGINLYDLNGNYRFPGVAIMGDVDNDGDLDMYSGLYLDFENPDNPTPDWGFRSAIFLNDGNAHFTIVENSGVEVNPGTECAAVFFDYDNDGCLDLAVGYWYRKYGRSYEAYPNRLYRGNCDGTFADVTEQAGMLTTSAPGYKEGSRPTYGATHCDWNNDGWSDLFYCCYGRSANYHWKNNGDGTFTNVADLTHFEGDDIRNDPEEPWWRQHGNTFSAGPADFNNDGLMDILLGEITHSWAGPASDQTQLLVNTGPDNNFSFSREFRGIVREHPNPNNWNQGDLHVGWMDFDMDGLQDAIIASGDYPDGQYLRIFKQSYYGPMPNTTHWFYDVTELADFNWEGSAAISVGDYDRDGDQDLMVGRSLARLPLEKQERYGFHAGLFENLVGNSNCWATFRLIGKGKNFSNRQGIGARVVVKAGDLVQNFEVLGGCGHVGQMNAQEIYVGLGKNCIIDELRVRWPNKNHTWQTFTNIPANRIYLIYENENELRVWNPQ